MESSIEISLLVLLCTSTIILITVAVFLIKLILASTDFVKDLSKTSKKIEEELEPTLQELKETLISVKSIAKNADEKLGQVKNTLGNIANAKDAMGKRVKGIFSGLVEGIQMGVKLFRK